MITDGIPSSEVGKTGHLEWGKRVTPEEEAENNFEPQSNMEKPEAPLAFVPSIANDAIAEWYSRMQSTTFFDGLGTHLDFEGFITRFSSLSDLVGKSDKEISAEYLLYLEDHKRAQAIGESAVFLAMGISEVINALPPATSNVPKTLFNVEAKISKQMGKRGWTSKSIDSVIKKPARTVKTTDTRWNADGTKMNDPATAYINKDGSYVVRNNKTGDIVQVSDRNDPNWRSPW